MMKASLANQEIQTMDKLRPRLKGFIPPQLSAEEIGELIEWLKQDAKNIPAFMIEEYETHVREIAQPPGGIRRDSKSIN